MRMMRRMTKEPIPLMRTAVYPGPTVIGWEKSKGSLVVEPSAESAGATMNYYCIVAAAVMFVVVA